MRGTFFVCSKLILQQRWLHTLLLFKQSILKSPWLI